MDGTRMRVVQPHEMFFSLTDPRGVITGANSVFSKISKLAPEELFGAPHNIVRSPEMPGGVFRLMWDTIQAGRPFAGYVQSCAADGVRYWVFATITPVPDGYLSVRTAPCAEEVWLQVAALYERVLREETRARQEGASRRAAAELGRDLILDALARMGYRSYEDFMVRALPTEAIERARRAQGAEAARGHGDLRLEQVRSAAQAIGDEAGRLLDRLQRFRSLSDGLHRAAGDASAGAQGLAQATASARAASELVGSAAPAVSSTARAMENGGKEALLALEKLGSRLDTDLRLLRGLQIRIALAKLHSDMVISFVEDLLGGGDTALGVSYVPEVCTALDSTVRLLTDALAAHTASMSDVVALIETISEELGQFQTFLFMWRSLLIRHGVSTEVHAHLGPIDRQLSAGAAQVVTLRDLARRCLSETHPYDSGPLMSRLQQLMSVGNDLVIGR